jgi:hypothetical protein
MICLVLIYMSRLDHFIGTLAGNFLMDASTAAITTAVAFDFETQSVYGDGTTTTLGVMATDSTSQTTVSDLTITIVDVAEDPVLGAAAFTGTCDEELAAGAAVTLATPVSATDEEDATSALTFSLTGRTIVEYLGKFTT